MPTRSFFLPLLLTALLALAAFAGAFRYFGSEERDRADGRLSLYESTVAAELQRFAHLTYVLSLDPFVVRAAEGGAVAPLNLRLAEFAVQAGLDAIYLMDRDGLTISASNHASTGSFLGQSYGFRPYFREALQGRTGRFYAIGATTGLPGYFIADPVRSASGAIIGAIAIKIDLSVLERAWRNSGEQVLLANSDGVVLLASDPAWQYRTLSPLTGAQRAEIELARQFTGQPLDALDWARAEPGRARIGGVERIHVTSDALPHGWVLHYFASFDQALTRSWLAAALLVGLAGLALIVFQVQRGRRVGAALARSEQEEADLRRANERLAVEIEERRTAERRLKRTQGELERASRLAALGQLAASVTHELGQPIAAMKNHLTAAELSVDAQGGLVQRIGGLVDRMEATARQLKFFARSEPEAFEDVDLGEAMRTALALIEPNRERAGAQIDMSLPNTPVLIRGSRLRIEQVMTNLIRNGLDAAEDQDAPKVAVEVTGGEDSCGFSVRDNGHGLGEATLAQLQEPFVTTRESGRGMGLGLAIAAGIVQDHGGEMAAENDADSGARFTVRFPVPNTDEATEAA